MKRSHILVLSLGLACAGAVQAAGIGVRAGTTGLGAEVGFGLMPTLSTRIGYSGLTYGTDIDVTNVRYDADLKLSNASVLLDWSPLGPFRLTGGFIFNDNRADVVGVPSGGSYTINGVTYSAADVGRLSGSIKSGNRAAPYLGIGYGNVAGAGINFYFDLGVMFQGEPKANLTAVCGPALPAAQCAMLQSDVAVEQARLQDDVRNFKYYPVANIGITIGF